MDTSIDMIEQTRELANRDGIDTTVVTFSVQLKPKFDTWKPISIFVYVVSKDKFSYPGFAKLGGHGHTVNEAWEDVIAQVRDYTEDGNWIVQR